MAINQEINYQLEAKYRLAATIEQGSHLFSASCHPKLELNSNICPCWITDRSFAYKRETAAG